MSWLFRLSRRLLFEAVTHVHTQFSLEHSILLPFILIVGRKNLAMDDDNIEAIDVPLSELQLVQCDSTNELKINKILPISGRQMKCQAEFIEYSDKGTHFPIQKSGKNFMDCVHVMMSGALFSIRC